jgi:hypothetical protein
MPRGNPHPVVKGRTRGVPNKFSVVRAERVEAAGKKLPPDELLRNAEDCRAMAGRYAPMRTDKTTGELGRNPDHDEERYSHWLAAERDALKAAAPYYSPRLSAIALGTSQLDKDKEARADPREALLEMILQMRERTEVGVKGLPKGNGHDEIIDAVVTKAVEDDEEDNGDGEAV